MFWRRKPNSIILITVGVSVILAICLPPPLLTVILALVLVWAGISYLCR